MWYLITFESYDLISVTQQQENTRFDFEEMEDNKPVFSVTEGRKHYEFEIIDDTPEAYRLTELNTLNPRGFILLNHAAVLLKWKKGVDDLVIELKKIFHKKDKYVIVPVTNLTASNFLDVGGINALLNQSSK